MLFFAERNVPTGLASLIIASVPLWVAVLRLLARAAAMAVLAGVGLGFAGVASSRSPRAARRAGHRAVRALGGDVGGRVVPLAAPDDAG